MGSEESCCRQREGTLGFQDVDVDHEGEVNFKFSPRILKKIDTPEASLYLWQYHLYLKKVKPSPERKMIKFVTFDTLFRH